MPEEFFFQMFLSTEFILLYSGTKGDIQAYKSWTDLLKIWKNQLKKQNVIPADPESFYNILNGEYKTFVGPGHWFEQERRYFRLGFGWPSTDELKRGLSNITRALEISAQNNGGA